MELKKMQLKKISSREVSKTYSNYLNALTKNMDAIPLSEDSFRNKAIQYGEAFQYNKSFILGSYNARFFFPSHYIPESNSEGIKMIKELSHYDNIIFFVTNKVSHLLEKMGYIKTNLNLSMNFRGQVVKKDVLVSSKSLAKKIDSLENKLDLKTINVKLFRNSVGEFLNR